MRVLALDTATSACTVAVVDGEAVLAELSLQVPRAHSTRLMPLIEQAIRESGMPKTELDAIAVGVGPGSFTGLRIGLATAKGLAFALGTRCVPVSTLAATAYGTGAQLGLVVPLFDAKRDQVFTAVYAAGDRDPSTWVELMPPSHRPIEELAREVRELRAGLQHSWQFVTLCGDAAYLHADRLGLGEAVRVAPAASLLPRASAVAAVGIHLLKRGGGVDPEALAPVYLRKSEAETLWESRTSPSTR
ncbi:MAG: tRNA (adenosine(37)-N6)-threonylcarbamoyltransferase complex dimerization subunit type 1 TsaB [Bacillota bacterium]